MIVRAGTGAIRDTSPEEVVGQDIVVTAFKYPTLLARNPAPISAITGPELQHRTIFDIATLARTIPSCR